MQKLPNVLIIEDDHNIATALSHALDIDYEVEVASTGKMAIYKNDSMSYDIIILDLNLPDISGYDVCQQLRERGVNTPILVLSGESKILTKINLLDAGANDFLTKPFSLGELKARMRSLMRHLPSTPTSSKQITVGSIFLDRNSRTVTRDGIDITLRRKEFALLECLMEHAGSVVTRDLLSNHVWEGDSALWTNTVDVHIKHLRDKIDRPFEDKLIRTVHGLGYKLDAQETATPRVNSLV